MKTKDWGKVKGESRKKIRRFRTTAFERLHGASTLGQAPRGLGGQKTRKSTARQGSPAKERLGGKVEQKPQHLGFPCGPPPWY